MRSFIWRWGPAIAVMAIIFAASATPGPDLPTLGAWDVFARKGGHLCGYALLAASLLHALTYGMEISRAHFIAAVCLAVLYAVSDEWHQTFTPGRSPSVYDVGIDTAGALIGASAFNRLRMYFARR
ncbi:MAG: VanZ family protein [Acidobacteria bacterium]|nr:VanZ family protein [Acidobacteriota bacterium]